MMESIATIWSCDDCEKNMVVLKKSIGDNCVIGLCTVCAEANVTTHDQQEIDDQLNQPSESMVIGVRVANIQP